MPDKKTISLAQKLWNYHLLNHSLKKSDCILVLGSNDLRVATRAVELYLAGWAPVIIFSGGYGNFTKDVWDEPEANAFAKIAYDMGVTQEHILIENKSSNTGENILFTQKLLKEKNLNYNSFLLVQKPYMERRSYATFKKHWPKKKLVVTSPQIPFLEYPNRERSFDTVINTMVGDLQRIQSYPEKGFQIYQEIPQEIWQAYTELVDLGYTKHLLQ